MTKLALNQPTNILTCVAEFNIYIFLSLQEVKRRLQDLKCPRHLLQDRRIDFPQPVHIYKSEVELELNIVKHEDPEFRWNPLKSDYVSVVNNNWEVGRGIFFQVMILSEILRTDPCQGNCHENY